jgi:hypothetical protein
MPSTEHKDEEKSKEINKRMKKLISTMKRLK